MAPIKWTSVYNTGHDLHVQFLFFSNLNFASITQIVVQMLLYTTLYELWQRYTIHTNKKQTM